MAVLLPMTCAATMVRASHRVGLTPCAVSRQLRVRCTCHSLAGMDGGSGLVSRSSSSAETASWAEPRYRMSFAIFIRLTAMTVEQRRKDSTIASCAASASNCAKSGLDRIAKKRRSLTLFGAVTNSWPVICLISAAIFSSKPFLC